MIGSFSASFEACHLIAVAWKVLVCGMSLKFAQVPFLSPSSPHQPIMCSVALEQLVQIRSWKSHGNSSTPRLDCTIVATLAYSIATLPREAQDTCRYIHKAFMVNVLTPTRHKTKTHVHNRMRICTCSIDRFLHVLVTWEMFIVISTTKCRPLQLRLRSLACKMHYFQFEAQEERAQIRMSSPLHRMCCDGS